MATVIEAGAWEEALSTVKDLFKIENLLPEQESAIKTFIQKGHVFVNLPTGYGKSLIYQCIPFVYDVLKSNPRGSSILVVISPLKSLMEDQIEYLGSLGIPSIAVGDNVDLEFVEMVKNGVFPLIYCSPECALSTTIWRGIFHDPEFREKLVGVAVDEAHCISQWGLSEKKKGPFRQWYGRLGELRSLIPNDCSIIVLTATATKKSQHEILESLNLPLNTTMIQQSPNRGNIKYIKQYMDKNDPLETQFGSIINELKVCGVNTPRTIVYCQTRKQCSVLYRLFEVYLMHSMYHGPEAAENRIVEMYHAGTPEAVKKHVSSNISRNDGHIRVLLSTIAFGMGVNCKSVRRIVHFGPSKSVECYIQECGRAGRDGLPSVCILLYNGLLSSHCDTDMKQYIYVKDCLRKWLMSHFSCNTDFNTDCLHDCCGNCMNACQCGISICKDVWTPQLSNKCNIPSMQQTERRTLTRVVTKADQQLLKLKLVQLQHDMLKDISTKNMVSCPNVLFEFNMFHINQILDNCHRLFCLKDVMVAIEIWRLEYAIAILNVIKDVFGAQHMNIPPNLVVDDMEEAVSEFNEWEMVRNDSTLFEMIDCSDLRDLSSTMDSEMIDSDSFDQSYTDT